MGNPSMQKKIKVLDSKKLKAKAWVVFSKWIREVRDGNVCFTCGDRNGPFNAGHFWHGVLDFDEENVHCQCAKCNHYMSGNLAMYSANLLRKIGPERFKELEIRHYRALAGERKSPQDYLDIIEKYKKKIANKEVI